LKLTDAQAVEVGLQPQPGAYVGVPFAEYLAWPYLSKSSLSDFAYLPAQHRGLLDGTIPRKDSAAFDVGSAVDAMWVEGKGLLEAGFRVWSGRKAGPKWVEFKAAHAGCTILSFEQERHVRGAVDALEQHDRACDLRDGATQQLSLVWVCPFTGLRLKGRPDLVDFDYRLLSDLKTARDVRPFKFDAAVADYNYHWQLYLYAQALRELGLGDGWKPWLIGVRNVPIHSVACRPLSADALQLAADEVTALLWQYRAAVLGDDWQRNFDDEKPIQLPGWRYRQSLRRENEG